jgi:putative endonuclease
MDQWYVYIVECADQTLYIGATNDVERRVEEHNGSPKGARYTRSRRPVSLKYMELHPSQSSALIREIALKRLTKKGKLELIKGRAN